MAFFVHQTSFQTLLRFFSIKYFDDQLLLLNDHKTYGLFCRKVGGLRPLLNGGSDNRFSINSCLTLYCWLNLLRHSVFVCYYALKQLKEMGVSVLSIYRKLFGSLGRHIGITRSFTCQQSILLFFTGLYAKPLIRAFWIPRH